MSTIRRTKNFAIASSLSSVSAAAASRFIDSIGVNIHMNYNNTTYVDGTRLLGYLAELGIKHVRDGVVFNRSDVYPVAQAIAAAGIDFNYTFGNPAAGSINTDIANYIAALKDPARYGGTAASLEPPNEYDLSGQGSWANLLYAYVGTAYTAVKADSTLGSLPYLGPSFGGSGLSTYSNNSLYPNRTAYLDAGNMHNYSGGLTPERLMPSSMTSMANVSGAKPIWATETGYHTALNYPNFANFGIGETSQSIYVLRSYLEYFRSGVVRTFLYELLDEKPNAAMDNLQQHFGLVSVTGDTGSAPSTWTVTKKVAFTSLKNMIALLADGNGATPASLSVAVTGGPGTLKQLLLGRSDGSYDLILWNNVSAHAAATYTPYNGFTRTAPYTVVSASLKNNIDDNFNPVGYTYPIGSVARDGEQDVEYAKYHQAQNAGELLPADIPVLVTVPSAMTAHAARPHYESAFRLLGRGQRILVPLGVDPTIVRLAA